MRVKVLCQDCSRYYRYNDDNGEMLCDGCKLDIPHFHSRQAIECSSHIRRGSMIDN